ncbi:MAG TPA: sensor histidine kinase [Opitutaceae bacterium]|nr:sensor histidine kinase [Opitutaceae bacterium]
MFKSDPSFTAQVVSRCVTQPATAWRKMPLAVVARWWLGLVIASPAVLMATTTTVEGLPLTRFYPFEEIGNVSRGAHLNFDVFGRIAVVQRGAYVVLNDTTWLDLTETNPGRLQILETKCDTDGTTYYGALGSWGVLTSTPKGKLRPDPLMPPDLPPWVLATNFDKILCTAQGVYFGGGGGVVFWDRHVKRHHFFPVSGVSHIFSHRGVVYVSSHSKKGVLVPDINHETLVKPDRSVFGDSVVGRFASAGPERAIVATSFRRLLIIRDEGPQPLPAPLDDTLPANVTALEQLPEGGVAASVAGVGLYILDGDGNIKTKLTGPDYSRVTALASHEAGVLWAATETGVIKILHGHPFTAFGQTLGLPVEWPQLVAWNGQLIIASRGRLYEPVAVPAGEPARFQPIPRQPGAGAWGIATAGSSLLVGNGNGVFVREPGGGFAPAVTGIDVARIVAIDRETCVVIGADEIGALRFQNGVWTECAPRIRGLGYPSVVHAGKNSAWIELGVNRAVRIALNSGQLETRLFETFPWARPGWVNVSVLGSTVVLAGSENERVFFDENTQAVVDAPAVRELLDQSPYPIQRICEDDTGTLWGSYENGIVALTRKDGRPAVDSTSYDAINEQYPLVQPLPGGDIWVSSGQSLYHLDRKRGRIAPPRLRPVLASVSNSRTHAELFRGGLEPASLPTLRYRENSLTFAFFAGSYALKRPPAYEFQLNNEAWQSVASGSSLALSDLHEGNYRLSVRLADSRGPVGTSWNLDFSVAAPWYRTWYAIAAYPLLAAGALFGLVRLSLRRAKARTAALETIVAERTRELQSTMDQLQRETRTSATLAERNRLAGEIHDSLEQGFTGLTLQLETTANFSACPPEVRNGLVMALNMVAFSRNEVRHAVQNLHSPVLDSADLTTALKQIIAQTAPSPGYATITTEGAPQSLGSTIEHHLLRIAQEAITNTVKHASASHLEVVLVFEKSAVHLTIRDNGHGFDPDAVLNGGIGHFGLPSFRGRANKIGGTVEIISRPGAGTSIVVHVPLGPGESQLS